MTKKDYELIASAIKQFKDWWNIDSKPSKTMRLFAEEISNALASKNPRFDKQKFLKACGVEVDKKCSCGLNPNYMQSEEQQKDEQEYINKNGRCMACDNED